ncbi:hypothetical protein OAO01_05790 [Oligoflexia bacterium]|nr:hypothetical protein [Oligoflexia bacterium]
MRNPIPNEEFEKIIEAAKLYADESRQIIKEITFSGFSISTKLDKSLVTDADTKIERHLREHIVSMFPTHGVEGEEFGILNPEAKTRWVLDPIDGTEEFVHGIPLFGTIISVFHEGMPMLGLLDHPALGLRTIGVSGQGVIVEPGGRRIYIEDTEIDRSTLRVAVSKPKNFLRRGDQSSIFNKIVSVFPNIRVFDTCFAYTCVAHGSVDVMLDMNIRIWDHGASQCIIPEAGGVYHPIHEEVGVDGLPMLSAVFGKPKAVQAVVAEIEKII